MYAVIETGGKQYKVAESDRLEVERLAGDEVVLRPVLLVDGDRVLATPGELGAAAVTARIVGEVTEEKLEHDVEDLLTLEGMDNQTARTLAEKGVVTKEDLADLAMDDLVEMTGIDAERAKQLIMTARAPWFA